MASTYLTRTPASAGNRKIWTWSGWIKKSKLGNVENIFTAGSSSDDGAVRYLSAGNFNLYETNSNGTAYSFNLETNALYRDVNGWYHLVVAVDTTQATASDRVKMYVNGSQVTFTGSAYPSQNFDTFINNNVVHQISKSINTTYGTREFDGSMTHIHFIDGTAYDASAFGQYDANGVWTINVSPSVTYGNNGFFILKNGNSVTDQSGNGNNWTVAGGTLTNTEDNPSNVFCTLNSIVPQAAGVSGRDVAVSPSLDNGNTTAGEGAAVFSNQIGTIFASSGKYYAECKFGGDQYCHFGIANPTFSYASLGAYPGASLTSGVNSAGIYGSSGEGRVNGSVIFTDSPTTSDTICLAMDLDNNALYIRRNDGAWMNSGNPESGATKTGAIPLPSDTYTWIVTSHNNSGSGRNYMKVNFGNGYFGSTPVASAGTNASGIGIFEYDVPTGYTALSTKGLNL